MSWPGEEWKVGLPAQALRAIAETEQRLQRLQKERQQKQVQMDMLEALMQKQKQKHEEERTSWALLSQQNRSLAESCDQTERARQRLAQELQAKDAQLSCLEAQLSQTTRRQTELEEELRRCQAELDSLQSRSPLVLLPPRWGSPTLWAEGSIETKAETSRSLAARPSPVRSCPPLGGAGRRDPPTICWQQEAACPSAPPGSPVPTENGESVRSAASELASTNERLKEENQELRLALTKAETLRLEKEKDLQHLRGELELIRAELAQCKKHRGDQAEADPRYRRGRRLSEDVSRSRNQQKGLLERLPPSGGHRSTSSSRQEQFEEKKGATTKGKGTRVQSNDGSRDELQILKAEVLVLQQRLQVSENQRKSLLETSLRHTERESQIGDQEKQVLPSDEEVPPLGAEGDLPKHPDLNQIDPKGDLEALKGELRVLASGKAEAETQASLAQQKLQSLQAMLGNQTERLAQAMETQKLHVEELLADAEEKDRLLKNLSRELEETRKELDVASAERRRLQTLLRSGDGVPCGTQPGEFSEPSRGVQAVETPKGNPPIWIPKDETVTGVDVPAGRPQEEVQKPFEVSVAQLARENQALRQELARWEARRGGDGATVDVPTEVVCLGEVPEAAQKRESLLQGSSRNAQTQTDPEGSHRRRERVSVAFDDTQYEPYGLPEVVMKGFADIPSGPSCPYVLRRGILGSAPVAQLAPRAEPEEDSPETEEGTGV